MGDADQNREPIETTEADAAAEESPELETPSEEDQPESGAEQSKEVANDRAAESAPEEVTKEPAAAPKPVVIRPPLTVQRGGATTAGPNFLQKHFSKFLFALIICLIAGGLVLRRRIAYAQENERFMRDIAVVENAFFQYAEGGDQKSSAGAPSLPANSNLRIEKKQHHDGTEVTEILINAAHQSKEKMAELDRKIDDGDLTTGRFTIRNHNLYAMKLMESKKEVVEKNDSKKMKKAPVRMPANMDQLDENFLLK